MAQRDHVIKRQSSAVRRNKSEKKEVYYVTNSWYRWLAKRW